ncbi:MAG: tRNA (N6-threonylcarbamoyladenosine(37)-N6)-methyltransferase TrmO [Clostridia bacterium]|nr:tRNA (N6-threonylcarbamoyladenosine(37)-N6)-methyltransferase TrmO [Clostridia bacterium]MBO7319333.1 tRNA (N6-threonylcarbamoyladenosine(37)-N6)-methyltransferase TrmO [Clostridia bacterium]
MKPIAYIYTDFKTKFGLPRQSGLIEEITGKIVFEKQYSIAEAFKGLEDFSHIWLLWEFSQAKKESWRPTVRPPLLGGNKRMGVFATRSPFRPNSIGLSCVKLEKIEYDKALGTVLYVSGCDLMNGTPIYDIKPYLPYCDSRPDASGGFTEALDERHLQVIISPEILGRVPEEKQKELISVLSGDPRPSYQDDPEREYGFEFADFEIGFRVCGKVLTVTKAEKTKK